MMSRILTILAMGAIGLASQAVEAGDLDRTLGLNRRVGFASLWPESAPFSYGRPIETIAVPDALMFPLQMANEGLTFYAAYRARNYRAMAAVSAMSLWGGSLRRGIDAVVGVDEPDGVSVEDLVDLSEREITILGYLWHTDGRSGSDLYRDIGGQGTWQDLSRELKTMEKHHLIRRTRSGSQDLYSAGATPADTKRAALVSGNHDRITAVLQAILASEAGASIEVSGD